MAFDPSKPVQTRGDKANGIPSKPVRILATDLPGDYPIGGLIEGFANLDRWTADGRLFMFTTEVDPYDLINVPEQPRKRDRAEDRRAMSKRPIDELTLARLWEAHASFASALQEDGDLRGWVHEILRRQKAFADLCLTAIPALLDERGALLAELDGAYSECLLLESELGAVLAELDRAYSECLLLESELGAAQSELDAERRALQKESE